jgi:hypothetical protein
MKEIKRYSPVAFKVTPLKTENRDHWDVVLEYHNEGDGPWLVDLCHRTRLDLQTGSLDTRKPFGITIPAKPGQSVLEKGFLINRMNRIQSSIYHLGTDPVEMPKEPEYTDVTESTVFLAIIGEPVFAICEKLSALDFMDKTKETPFLYQGPFSHVPCQIVTLSREGEKSGIVMTCSRGYAKDMVDAILHAGEEFGLKPAGEKRATEWINSL